MAATLEIVIAGRDQFSGTVGKATMSFSNLAKAGLAAGIGFNSVEGAMQATKRVLTASIGAALAYEGQMAKIRALTGATKQDTILLNKAIFAMTKEMPKSPAELGAGAYYVLSSGITDAGDAANVLRIAARASTVGLGETSVVADALTTVLNAYGKEAGEAGQVTDVLIQAVKDGKAEAEGFSSVLGRVVPVAAQMGVSFEEVAANLATFTRLGVGADQAATGLRGVMVALLKPTEEGKELLAQYGMSMDEIRKSVRERGLAATLQDLMKKFGGNEEALSKLFPEVRGLTDVLATAGSQGEAYTEILGNMDTATGNLDRGFKEVSDTTQFKLNKAMNDLNVQLQLLGEETLPAIPPAIAGARIAIEEFTLIPRLGVTHVKNFGDALDVWGSDAKEAGVGLQELQSITADMIGTGNDLAGVVGTLGPPVDEVAGAVDDLGKTAAVADEKVSDLFKDFQKGVRDTVTDMLPLTEEFSTLADSTAAAADEQQAWNDRLGDLGDSLADAEKEHADATQAWSDDLTEMGRDLAKLETDLSNATDPEDVERLTERIHDLHRKMDEGNPSIDRITEKMGDLRNEMGKAPNITPIISGFDAWRERVGLLAEDYSAMKDNMQTIMDALVSQHVVGVADIMAVIREQGPTYAANFAQWFRDDPIAAATTVKEIMPGIMGEAAQKAIANVLAEISKFNEAWQRDVRDALTSLPEEKRVAITSNIDPQFWLLSAQLAKMEPGLNIPLTLEQLMQAGQFAGAQHGAFIPPGVVMPMMLHGGAHGEAVVPLAGNGNGGMIGGGVMVNLSIGTLGAGVTREHVTELREMLEDEMRNARRRGL